MSGERYFRNARGEIIHKAGCRRIGKTALSWEYANDFSAEEIAGEIEGLGWLNACSTCRPDLERSA